MTRRLSLVIVATSIIGSVAPAIQGAEFLDFYKLGLSAAESQQWSQAAEMMRQAIDDQPSAKVKVKKSLFFRRYLPHFHLGRALFESGDCPGALVAWEESESQGIVVRFPEYQQLQDGRLACSQMSDLQVALEKALRAIKQAEASAELSRQRLAALPISDSVAKSLFVRQTEAEASLGRVSSRLAAGTVALGKVEEAARVAAVTRQEFVTLERLAQEQRGVQLQQMRSELTSQVEPLIEAAREELAASEYLRPYPTAVARSRVAVEQALQHSRALEDSSLTKSEIEALESELETTTEALRQATSPPPATLTAAAAAFLERDYSGVLIALAESEFTSSRATAHAHLLKAAALFSLYHATGASDEALIEGARAEALACQRADPQQIPPIAVFSPSFLTFYREQVLESAELSADDESGRQGT